MPCATEIDATVREPRALVLLVRCLSDLERANRELSAYRSSLRAGSAACAPDVLQGIWVGETALAHLPAALTWPGEDGMPCSIRIPETTGVDGIWTLCRLDAPARTVSRTSLVAALLDCIGPQTHGAPPVTACFIPVFAADAPRHHTDDAMRALRRRYPDRVLSPVHVGPDGTLRLPPAGAPGEDAS